MLVGGTHWYFLRLKHCQQSESVDFSNRISFGIEISLQAQIVTDLNKNHRRSVIFTLSLCEWAIKFYWIICVWQFKVLFNLSVIVQPYTVIVPYLFFAFAFAFVLFSLCCVRFSKLYNLSWIIFSTTNIFLSNCLL